MMKKFVRVLKNVVLFPFKMLWKVFKYICTFIADIVEGILDGIGD